MKFFKIFSLIILICIILFLAIEIYLRFTSTYLKPSGFTFELYSDPIFLHTPVGKRLKPNVNLVVKNHHQSQKDVVISINSLGFRGPEFSASKEKNEYRILAVGDSVTYQDGLNDEETWVRLLEGKLNATPSGKFYRVINGGVGDVGIKEEIDNLKSSLPLVKPDLVILQWYLNDSRPPWGFTSELGYRGIFRRYSVFVDTVYRQLKLKNWIKEQGLIRSGWGTGVDTYKWMTNREDFLKFAKYSELDWGAGWNNESWDIIQSELEQLHKLSQQYNFKVLVVAFPVIYQVQAEFVEDTPQKRLSDLSQQNQFSFIDLLPFLRNEQKVRHLFFDYVHLNEAGSKVVADYLSRNLLEN